MLVLDGLLAQDAGAGARMTSTASGRSVRRRAPVREFVQAALSADRPHATRLALEFQDRTGSVASVITDLFTAAQLQIGDRWHVGEATSEDEYRVSLAIAAAAEALRPTTSAPRDSLPMALLATLPGEAHDLGLHLIGLALVEDGWEVETASAMELEELVDTVRRHRVDLVGISSTYDRGGGRMLLTTVIRSVHSIGLPVLVGGAAFARSPHLADESGADAVGGDARLAVILARRLKNASRGHPPSRRAPRQPAADRPARPRPTDL
jgi:methanogenic corrinoid protein MtbC1